MSAPAQQGSDSLGKRPALLCYDGSPDAKAAIERAAEIISGGPALILYVWLPPSALMLEGRVLSEEHPLAPAAMEFDATAAAEAERLAAEGAGIASGAGFEATPITERAAVGVWRTIIRVADEHDARTVVLGSHGRSAAGAALLGGVSLGVVNHCRRPVLVVPSLNEHVSAQGS